MTFTTKVKEEITANSNTNLESLVELSSFIRYSGQINKDKISLTIENPTVARRIYKDIKSNFNVNVKITVRIQKRFRVKQIYILDVFENISDILEKLNIINNGKKTLPSAYFLESNEDKIAYLKGAFLASGSINNPSTGGYHLEFTTIQKNEGAIIQKILHEYNINSKIIKRNNRYMVYVKSAEMISDFIKLIGVTNSLFYFEDIRIYRDHKNMVNRLNNCEIANQEKILKSGLKQLDEIAYLEEHDLIDLLDDNIKETIKYRQAYPETSLQELADIITTETGRKIGKSGINHYFIKIKNLVEQHKEKNGSQ